jgi:RNA-binding protein YhbY
VSEFFLYIANGQITNKATVANQFKLADGSYLVTIKSKKNRSIPQNRFWWGCLIPLVKQGLNDAGYDEVKTNEDAHEVIKALFLKKMIANQHGEALEMAGSTTELTTIEFNGLIEDVQRWAADFLGVDIPNPNEQTVLFQ